MKNELTRITSQRLREALSNKNMTAQELSNASGVGKASISQYVNGSHAPGNIAAYKMSSILNVRPEWLMGFDVPMKPESTSPEVPVYVDGTMELIQLFGKATPEQREATLNLLRSFVQ